MAKALTIAGLMFAVIASAASTNAGPFHRHPRNNQGTAATTAQPQRTAPVYAGSPPPASVWPVYPNYGNSVGAAYSAAAGLRQGQFFGTFGLRPADARARGAY